MSSLLPSDKYLASMLGLTDEEYSWFKAEVRKRSAEAPEPAVVAGTIDAALAIAIINLVIGVGLTVVSTLLRPKPSFDEPGRPPELRATSSGGQTTTQNQRFAPRYGFNSTQEISTLGSIVPLVYTNKETIASIVYGGVRVNTQLLWSQIYSLGGSQMLRAIFLVGEGPIAAIEPSNFASGGNTLTSYDFGNATANQIGSRMAVYARYASGLTTRIAPGDHIYGRSASEDVGNSSNLSGSEVFGVRVGNSVTQHFCATQKPANQTTFGVYAFCGNDFGMRPNPTFEPQVRAQLLPEGDEGKTEVKCVLDEAKYASRKKAQAFYGSRSGITSSGLGSIGGTTTYKLFSSAEFEGSDQDTVFSRDIEDLTNTSSWVIEKELITPETPAGYVKQFDTGSGSSLKAVSRYKSSNIENLANSLLNRLSVSITTVVVSNSVIPSWEGRTIIDTTNVGGSNKAYIAVNISFDSSGLDSISNNNAVDTELELLKASKFKIRLKNDLTADDPEDDIKIVQFHKILVEDDTQQAIGLTTPSYSSPSLATGTANIDGTTVLTSASLSSGSVTFSELDVTTTQQYPKFKFDRDTTSWQGPGTTSNSFTFVSWFSIKDAYVEKCKDIASVVAGRQQSWDNSIVVGELYKIGTGLAVCTNRTNGPFHSAVEGSALTVEATFKTVRTGVVTTNSQSQIEKAGDTWLDQSLAGSNPEPRNVATTDGHIMRCAIASVSTTRPCKTVEFGIKSTLGTRINGLTNFDTTKGYNECDNRACLDYKGNILNEGTVLYTDIHTSNLVSTTVERYSFFYISYRVAGTSGAFTRLNNAYGIRGATSQQIFNYIQLDMPSVNQWEFQIEPLTGYEVRNHVTGSLYVLDASYIFGTTQLVSETGGISVLFTGVEITKSADTFAISIGRRPSAEGQLNYPQTDANFSNGDTSLIDTWGKLAESFVYEEISSSAETGPEHEIVYINEIVPNSTQANYDNLALIGVNINSSVEWQQFSQFSCYVTGGKTCRQLRSSLAVGATHLLPDIVLDLMTNSTYGRGDLITDDMVNFTEFTAAANWCYSRKYFFDGVIADKINIRQWCADVAATHLLIFGESDGKFFLRPALQFDAVAITGLFSAGNIVENSFKLQYFDPEERDPIQISVRYREERASTNLDNPGMFPTVREVLVRESSASETVSLETIDMSDYCTSRQHAIDAAKFVVRMRRIPTHTVSFTTTHEGVLMAMAPGDYIKVGMDATEYDEFNNGVVTPEGALVSTKSLADGSYAVIAWNGDSDTTPADTTLAVSNNGKAATPTGIVFTVKLPSTQVRTYQIERITPTEEGTFTIEAVHMPTNGSDILELADGFDTAGNWSIQD
jgi:hypothetical protein